MKKHPLLKEYGRNTLSLSLLPSVPEMTYDAVM